MTVNTTFTGNGAKPVCYQLLIIMFMESKIAGVHGRYFLFPIAHF
jgi:hypothetical protein